MQKNIRTQISRRTVSVAAVVALAGCATAESPSLRLTGSEQVPPVATSASATANIRVWPSWVVTGSVVLAGIDATAVHIHEGAPGTNGPVLIALVRAGGNRFEVPTGASLTDGQYTSYQHGRLYLNVHSAAHPGGEIRAQIPWVAEYVPQTMRPDWSY